MVQDMRTRMKIFLTGTWEDDNMKLTSRSVLHIEERDETMQNPPRERPVKDERDEMIDRDAKNWSLEFIICATQVLTVICAVKGNSAWRGSLSLLFFGIAAALIYKYSMYRERPYLYVGLVNLAIGLALIIWFAVTG